MEKLYFMVTVDELEWPIAVGRTIEELTRDSGKSERVIYSKMRNQRKGSGSASALQSVKAVWILF